MQIEKVSDDFTGATSVLWLVGLVKMVHVLCLDLFIVSMCSIEWVKVSEPVIVLHIALMFFFFLRRLVIFDLDYLQSCNLIQSHGLSILARMLTSSSVDVFNLFKINKFFFSFFSLPSVNPNVKMRPWFQYWHQKKPVNYLWTRLSVHCRYIHVTHYFIVFLGKKPNVLKK